MKNLIQCTIPIIAASILLLTACAPRNIQESKAKLENKPGYESTASPTIIQSNSGQPINSTDEMPDRLNQILRVVDNVKLIALSHKNQQLDDNNRSKIDKEVEQIKKPRDLVTLALICRAIENYDHDFEEAFWHCVDQLADNTSDEFVEALNMLMQDIRPESGDKQLFEEALSHQQEKKRQEKERHP